MSKPLRKCYETFKAAKENNQKLFIPYITCGDGSLDLTRELVIDLTALGSDMIELGIPYSDPVADGEINQLAAMRALKHRVSLRDCCQLVHQLRQQDCHVPIILFTYFNPIMRMGMDVFARLARESGVDAVLVVDLPLEESSELIFQLQTYHLGYVMLITSTTPLDRVAKISKLAPDFLYYVSRAGVTGVQKELSSSLATELSLVKKHTHLPIAVGFGISTPEQAAMVASLADGVVVGSALVKQLEAADPMDGKANLLKLAVEIRQRIL